MFGGMHFRGVCFQACVFGVCVFGMCIFVAWVRWCVGVAWVCSAYVSRACISGACVCGTCSRDMPCAPSFCSGNHACRLVYFLLDRLPHWRHHTQHHSTSWCHGLCVSYLSLLRHHPKDKHQYCIMALANLLLFTCSLLITSSSEQRYSCPCGLWQLYITYIYHLKSIYVKRSWMICKQTGHFLC